jgi:hypothetical protein
MCDTRNPVGWDGPGHICSGASLVRIGVPSDRRGSRSRANQSVLAGGTNQSIDYEHKHSVGEGDAFGAPERCVRDLPEAELIEQGPDGEYRSPSGGIDDFEFRRNTWFGVAVASEKPLELGKDLPQDVGAPEIDDRSLLGFAASDSVVLLAVRLCGV